MLLIGEIDVDQQTIYERGFWWGNERGGGVFGIGLEMSNEKKGKDGGNKWERGEGTLFNSIFLVWNYWRLKWKL